MDLDTKDRRILGVLDLDGRASYADIGGRVGLSKETVHYRMRRLEKGGVIGRYTTLVNFAKLGYTGYAVFNRLTDMKRRDAIIEDLRAVPELYWIALVGGRYDLVFALMCTSVVHFNKLYYGIRNRYGKYLVDSTVSIRTELRQTRRGYLPAPEDHKAPFFGKDPEAEELDALDASILSELSNTAREPVLSITKKVGHPASTVALRIRRMERRGIIQGYTAYIRAQRYGMQSYRLLIQMQDLDEKERNRLFSYAQHNPCMILAIETVGPWSFEITLEVKGHEDLQKEVAALREAFPAIRNIEFLIMFEDDLVYDPYPLKKNKRKIP